MTPEQQLAEARRINAHTAEISQTLRKQAHSLADAARIMIDLADSWREEFEAVTAELKQQRQRRRFTITVPDHYKQLIRDLVLMAIVWVLSLLFAIAIFPEFQSLFGLD